MKAPPSVDEKRPGLRARLAPLVATPLRAALVAALVALAVRLALIVQGPDLPPDGVFDLEIARDLQHGDWRGALLRRFHPLGGALAACVASVLHREADEACGLAVSVAAGALAAFFAALAAGELAAGTKLGARTRAERLLAVLGSGFLVAAHPALARSAATVWSYPLSHAALAAALLATARALGRGSLGAALGAGVAAGFAYLARPDGLVILAGLVAGVVASGGLLGAAGRGARGAGPGWFDLIKSNHPAPPGAPRHPAPFLAAALVAGFALPAAPYVLALHEATHEWRLTLKKDERHLVGMRDLQAPPPRPRPADDLAGIVARSEGHEDQEELGLAASALYVLRRSTTAVHPLLLVLGAVGVLVARDRRRLLPGALVVLAFLSAHTLLKANEKDWNGNHASAEAVVLAVFSGLGLAPLAGSRRARTLALGACVAILLAKTRDARSLAKSELTRAVAAALRERAAPGRALVVCGRDARPLAFLAGARLVEMPRGDAASVVSAASAEGAQFLAIYVRTHGEAPAPVQAALAAAGVRPPERFTASRPAEGGSILYTWLVYDLPGEKR